VSSARSSSVVAVSAVGCTPAVLYALSAAIKARAGWSLDLLESWDALPEGTPPDIAVWSSQLGPDALAVAVAENPDTLFLCVVPPAEEAGLHTWIDRGAADALVETHFIASAGPILEKSRIQLDQRRAQRRLILDLRTTASQLKARSDRLEHEMTRLEAMAWTDPLTGLANRRQLNQRVPQLFAEAVRYTKDLACLMIDLDHFKGVNDHLGHAKGDDLLCAASRLITSGLRTSDIAVRYGGDEFVVLMPQTPAKIAGQVARRLVDGFAAAVQALAPTESCGMSVGISCLRTSGPIDGDDLIAQADSALLAAKKHGKGRIMLWAADGRHAETP
jgi:diguanylate cyclase (GGDEF)-like protein